MKMNMSDSTVATTVPFICLGSDGGGNGAFRSSTTRSLLCMEPSCC